MDLIEFTEVFKCCEVLCKALGLKRDTSFWEFKSVTYRINSILLSHKKNLKARECIFRLKGALTEIY